MLINNSANTSSHVKFISYTGKYPCLCHGVLTLEIDGAQYKFGYDPGCDFTQFWSSGGNCYFTNDYADEHVESGEWKIDVEDLPDQFKKYASEIDSVFNSNVEHGCCGGCL